MPAMQMLERGLAYEVIADVSARAHQALTPNEIFTADIDNLETVKADDALLDANLYASHSVQDLLLRLRVARDAYESEKDSFGGAEATAADIGLLSVALVDKLSA